MSFNEDDEDIDAVPRPKKGRVVQPEFAIVATGALVTSNDGQHATAGLEEDAIKRAQSMSVEQKRTFEVYQLVHIGTTTMPISKFVDHRPQSPREA